MVGCERGLQQVREKEEGFGGDYLRELLVLPRSLQKLPGDVMRKLLIRGG